MLDADRIIAIALGTLLAQILLAVVLALIGYASPEQLRSDLSAVIRNNSDNPPMV